MASYIFFFSLSQDQAEGLSRYKVSLMDMHIVIVPNGICTQLYTSSPLTVNLNELIRYELIGAEITLIFKFEYFFK